VVRWRLTIVLSLSTYIDKYRDIVINIQLTSGQHEKLPFPPSCLVSDNRGIEKASFLGFFLFFFYFLLLLLEDSYRKLCAVRVNRLWEREIALTQAVSRFVAVSGYALSGLCQILFIYTFSPLSFSLSFSLSLSRNCAEFFSLFILRWLQWLDDSINGLI